MKKKQLFFIVITIFFTECMVVNSVSFMTSEISVELGEFVLTENQIDEEVEFFLDESINSLIKDSEVDEANDE